MRGGGERGEIMMGTERTGEEGASLISLCDTLNYKGASWCNIHFY